MARDNDDDYWLGLNPVASPVLPPAATRIFSGCIVIQRKTSGKFHAFAILATGGSAYLIGVDMYAAHN